MTTVNTTLPSLLSTTPIPETLHGITSGDIVVVVLYFIVILAIGLLDLWLPRARRWLSKSTVPSPLHPTHEVATSADFFLASREMSWPAVMASLFASNIGSEHFIGLAGSGAATGQITCATASAKMAVHV
jgi:Na+/proline symporter